MEFIETPCKNMIPQAIVRDSRIPIIICLN